MKIKLINKSTNPNPEYQTNGSSGLDLTAFGDYVLKAKSKLIVGTGIYVSIPAGYEGQVRSRSGLAAKNDIFVLNGIGTIDSDYRGEIKVILFNLSNEDFEIKNGNRIAQLVIVPVVQAELEIVDSLESTERGSGKFGSTGL